MPGEAGSGECTGLATAGTWGSTPGGTLPRIRGPSCQVAGRRECSQGTLAVKFLEAF